MESVVKNFNVQIKGNRVIWEGYNETVWLEAYGKDQIRFRSSKANRIDESLDWNLIKPEILEEDVCITKSEDRVILRSGNLEAQITDTGVISYFENGRLLLEELWLDPRGGSINMRGAREYRTVAGDLFQIDLYFKAWDDEHFFGMGQDPNDVFDLKGSTTDLCQKNSKISIPFAFSTRGYGFLWNNPATGRAEFVSNHTAWRMQAARQIDYIVIAGDSPQEINEKYTALVGRAGRLPEWAAGFWQCKLRYETQEELLAVAREYKRREIPLSVIVIDFFHWTQQGDWKFDPKFWPNPRAMVEELNEMGVKLVVSIWPTVDPRSENFAYMRENNLLVRGEYSDSVLFMALGPETHFDATNPEARTFVFDRVKENYMKYGIEHFWLDEAEPDIWPYDYGNLRYYAGNGLQVSSLYPDYYARTFYEGLKQEGKTDIVNLIRCAWHGTQRFNTVVWSGDILSSFEELRVQMKAGLNLSLCGIPWWTTDIGGFFDGDIRNDSFRELLIRWFQFGVFCPIFRLHGHRMNDQVPEVPFYLPDGYCYSGADNEVWSFGEQAYGILKELIDMRYRLMPYIMHHMELASATGTPVMRPLFFDFFHDKETLKVSDEFMFGDEILVAPVIVEGAVSRSVYLPDGAEWKDVYTKKMIKGGTSIMVDAPLDRIPLFLKNGAELPIFPSSDDFDEGQR